ncbi:MAG TPA: serine protease [Gaiellaceae bacterium]|nr:serine protease [Gaiellaceae bacterium]
MSLRICFGLSLAAVALAFSAGPVSSAIRIVGGTSIQIQSAPWDVFITYDTGAHKWRCTGAVIDATHVVTAGHCVYGEGSEPIAPPSQLSVQAGISNPFSPSTTDVEQDRTVSSYRVHPSYVHIETSTAYDVAVLTLATPLDLSGPAVKAVALPQPAASYPTGSAVTLSGFGAKSSAGTIDGALASMSATVEPQDSCGQFTHSIIIEYENATQFCATSSTSATCAGDSGAALVTNESNPVMIGVNSGGVSGCPVGSVGIYTYVTAPSILRFIEGDNQPPAAPRRTADAGIGLAWARPLRVGDAVTCSTGPYRVPVHVVYSFLNAVTNQVLQTGSHASYVASAKSLGTKVFCQVKVTSAGGTLLADTVTSTPIKSAPHKKTKG